MISPGSKTILLVEDEVLIAMSEKLILDRYGYKVMVASSGEKAIEAAVDFKGIDLILMDINLGSGMDGTQAAVEILKQRDLPLAFLSSHSEREVVEKTEGITSYGYILKNSGETVLVASVKMAFRLFEAKLNEKAKEEALRASEARQRSIFEHMAAACFVGEILYENGVAVDYRIENANPAFERITGISVDSAIGSLASNVYGTGTSPFLEMFERVARTGQPAVFEADFKPLDKHLLITVGCPEPGKFSSVLHDVTERKCLEEKLSISDRIFTHSLDMLCVAGFDGFFKVLNPSWERILGWSTAELLARPWIDFVHPDDRDNTGSIRSSLVDGREVYQFENRYVCKNGEVKWLSWNSFPYPEDGIMFGVARDVTEKKQMEEALRESEQTFKALFEKGPIGVAYHQMVYDENGKPVDYRFLAANDSYQKLTGVDPSGKLVTEAFPGIEKDRFDWIGTFGRVAGTGEEIRFQQHLEANDRWYDCVGYQYKPDHFVAAFLEVTEQKRAERALSIEKEQLRVTLESIGDAVIATDTDGKVEFLNKVAEELTGWTMDRAKGRPLIEVFRIVNAFTRLTCENPVEKAIREGTIVGLANHTVLISADGNEHQIADSAAPIRDDHGSMRGVVLVFRDVSDDYRLNESLHTSVSELKKAQAVARLGSWVWHIQSNKLEWSDQMFTIFGLDKESFSGELAQVIAGCIHPDDRPKVEQSNSSVVAEMKPIPLEYRIVRPDGAVRHVWAEAGDLVVDEGGKPALLRGIVQDITDKKQSEKKIQDLLREKELLLRETHHRVKNNMGLIYSLLNLQAATSDGTDPRPILHDAAGRVKSMLLLYDRLYRTESFTGMSLKSVLLPLVSEIIPLFPEKPVVRVEEEIDELILPPKTISTIGIIINELVTNSMKYAFSGRRGGLIRIEASSTGSRVCIVYRDDGIGLPESVGFDDSTGFGMQLIGLLVEQLDGTIQIDRFAGTRFVIDFPC